MKAFTFLFAIAALMILTHQASGWLRPSYEDAEVVARSELIVVGAIKPDTLEYIPHKEADSTQTLGADQVRKSANRRRVRQSVEGL